MILYKYCILEKLENLSVKEYRIKIKAIPLALRKTQRTFKRYYSLQIQDHGDIPSIDLDIIAYHLNCTAKDLKNYTVTDGKLLFK